MAKRFSIVSVKNEEIFLKGFALPKDLPNSNLFLEVLGEIPTSDSVNVEINHCLLLDFPGDDSDITVEELNILLEKYDYLIENDHIYSEEIITFAINGLKEKTGFFNKLFKK